MQQPRLMYACLVPMFGPSLASRPMGKPTPVPDVMIALLCSSSIGKEL